MRYLPVNVFTSGEDCTNGGVTSLKNVRLVVEHELGSLGAKDVHNSGYSVLELCTSKSMSDGSEYKYLKPKGVNSWLMFGGNYVSTSDSRFHDLNRYPLPVHDRIES